MSAPMPPIWVGLVVQKSVPCAGWSWLKVPGFWESSAAWLLEDHAVSLIRDSRGHGKLFKEVNCVGVAKG